MLAGAHTVTNTDLYSMEGAVESGRRAADILSAQSSVIPQQVPLILQPFQAVDKVLYKFGLPHVMTVLLIVLLLVGTWFALKKYRQQK